MRKTFTKIVICDKIIVMKKLILASKSPRRIDILGKMGYKFEIIPAVRDEVVDFSLSGAEMVEKTAKNKAQEIVETHSAAAKNSVIIGMDTVVIYNGEVLQKPKNAADQREMLKKLSGNKHEVYTGYCVLVTDENAKIVDEILGAEKSDVLFNELSGEELEAYAQSGKGLDKAGGYGVQDGFGLVKEVFGSTYNVIGFPKEKMTEILKKVPL